MDIDDTIETLNSENEDAKPSPLLKRKLRPSYAIIILGIILLIIAPVLFIFFAPASWVSDKSYILSPGSANNTAQAIIVDGTPIFPPEGEIAYTTVSIKREVTLWQWIRAKQDETKQLISPSVIDGGRTVNETRKVTQFQMEQSQSTAALVALNFLGYEIIPEIEGAFVIQLVEGSPAEASLQLGDLIVEVNNEEVRSPEDLGNLIQAKEPGDMVEITFLRSPSAFGGSGADDNAVSITEQLALAEHPQREGRGFLGVVIETPVRADVPFEITIDVGNVRGPSAGLAFSLSILDVITEGELTGGLRIATTGTIDRFGNIGPVGGVPQKTEAAIQSGIELFLVPPGEYVTASEIADERMEIRCVQTFTDAILVLEEFGGNGVEVAKKYGITSIEFSESPIDEEDGVLSCAEAELAKNR
ncbi:MAG: hypothetical protein CL470_05415 [Acidimicrobiaceae bacterium]|nr:hypothetical protein [Acidimicrobiaceae bacterium]